MELLMRINETTYQLELRASIFRYTFMNTDMTQFLLIK